MIGKLADAMNRMFAVEKVQDQHSGNQVERDDKINIVNFEKSTVEKKEKVSEVTDTYKGKRIKDDESNSEKEKKGKKEKKRNNNKSDKEQDSEYVDIKHIDEKA